MLTISSDTERIDRTKLHAWLKDAYWARNRSPQTIDRSLDHSLNFSAWEDDAMVGFARVVTDYATFAWLCDVYVDLGHWGRGVGKALVAEIIGRDDLKDVRWLLGTRDAHSLYEQFGFVTSVETDRWMTRSFAPRPVNS